VTRRFLLVCALLLAACGGAQVEALTAPWAGLPGEAADPAIAVDESGALLAAWVGGEGETWHVWFARSADGGGAWSDPVRVTTAAGQAHPHAEASPRLAAAPDGRVALVWTNQIPVEGRRFPASDLLASTSADGGRTWSVPARVNDDAGGAPEGHTFHGAVWAGGDTLVAAWLDGRGMAGQATAAPAPAGMAHDHAHADSASAVWIARSGDFGATWSANRALWASACPCCRVDLARSPDGAVVAGWRGHFPGDVRDVVVAPLPEEGAAPVAPKRVHPDAWVYPACPHSGPALAADGEGRLHVAWFTGKPGAAGVYYARGGAREFSAPAALVTAQELPVAHPALVALDGGGAVVAWDVSADGERRLTLARIDPEGRETARVEMAQSAPADHPRLARYPDGSVVVAWTVVGDAPQVRLARVRLGG